jgi:predicted PurR-regulated permease PerM
MSSASLSFVSRVLIVAAVVLLGLLAWRLLDLIALVFGSIVAAVALRAMAAELEQRARVPHRLSVLLAVLLVIALVVAIVMIVGQPLGEQIDLLRERLPQAVHQFIVWLGSHAVGVSLLRLWQEMQAGGAGVPWARLASYAGLTLGALGGFGLMLVIAIFLAAEPNTYRFGVLRLLPPPVRPRVDEALQAAGAGLRGWLKGQALSMLYVGTTTTIGVALLGGPLALALGLVNGLLAFVPYIGAIGGGLLAVLVAFIDGPRTALYVALLMVAIQQVESHVVQPLVQKWAVSLPPVLGLVAAVVFGVLFGVIGVLLATPLMVVTMVLVQRLYIEGMLERAGP